MAGMEATTDLFINLIQNNRIIYDKSLKDFKNTRKKEEAWQNIALQSRMAVDAAKKRYASLRQKYSREKRNCELRRRNKTSASRNWVYYERLRFLDSFIQPRATYTNDTFVEEEDQDQIPNEVNVDELQTINSEVEDGIVIEEYGDLYGGNDFNGHVDAEREALQNDERDQQSNKNICNRREQIVSQYSQEESALDYHSSSLPHFSSCENEDDIAVVEMDTQESSSRSNGLNEIVGDDYVSPHAGTSSSFRIPAIPPYPSRCYDPKTGEIVIAKTMQLPSNNRQLNKICESSQQCQSLLIQKNTPASTQSTRSDKTIPGVSSTATSLRSTQSQPVKRSNALTTSSSANIASSASPLVSMSMKEKRMEAIRQKMENCMTAITNKVSDKAQRSPHGPFLSYLGTKLPSVSAENLPKLEREILDLVDRYAM